MSIRADIILAKSEYDSHVSTHKCGQLTKCPERTKYWQAWMGTAALWGQEYDDDQRQKDHYREMTYQTFEPIERLRLENTYRSARELVNMMRDGMMTTDLPYQRGDVWTLGQRIELIRSWLSGTPIPSIIINDRWNSYWDTKSGPVGGTPGYAVIDGKQRLETARMWYDGEFAVPASWFEASEVLFTEDTDDGPYVRYAGLSRGEQTGFALTVALFPFAAAKVATVEEEAAIYGRVNGGGTPQTKEDMARAERVAKQKN